MRLALLVLAAGCWSTTERVPDPIDDRPAPAPTETAPDVVVPVVDAGVDAAVDAGALQPVPAPCLRARILSIRVVSSGIEVIVGVGSRDGVQPSWRARHANPNLTAKIVRVAARQTVIALSGTPDQIQQIPYLVLCP